jgi:hypothetical protein
MRGYNSNLREQVSLILSSTKTDHGSAASGATPGREVEFSRVVEQLEDATLAMAILANVPEEADRYWSYFIELANWEMRKARGLRNELFLRRFLCLSMAYAGSKHRSRLRVESILRLDFVHPSMALWCCYLLGRAGIPWQTLMENVRMMAEAGQWPPIGASPQDAWNQFLLGDFGFVVWVMAAWMLEDEFNSFAYIHYENGMPFHKRQAKVYRPWVRLSRFAWTSLLICGASVTLAWMNLRSYEQKAKETVPVLVEPVLVEPVQLEQQTQEISPSDSSDGLQQPSFFLPQNGSR